MRYTRAASLGKYSILLTGSSLQFESEAQFEWQDVLRFAWLNPDP
jgi:hypothetical protein